jgi:hypothetical protein
LTAGKLSNLHRNRWGIGFRMSDEADPPDVLLKNTIRAITSNSSDRIGAEIHEKSDGISRAMYRRHPPVEGLPFRGTDLTLAQIDLAARLRIYHHEQRIRRSNHIHNRKRYIGCSEAST